MDANALERVGRYRVDRTLGSGGMGTVYAAWDELLRRQVALKVLHGAASDLIVEEARAMAAVRHPNIVTIYSIETDGDRVSVVMERIDGRSLEDLVATDGLMHPRAATQIVRTIAAALGAVHEAGMLHGDVKPSNVLVEQPSGRIVVTDFGLAEVLARAPGSRPLVRGTPEYLCPERACGHEVQADLRVRQDVYALACTAFELLTGRTPYQHADVPTVLWSQVHSPIPRASELRAGLGWRVDAALCRALAKDPGARTPSAEAFAADLSLAVKRGGSPLRVLIAEDDAAERQLLAASIARRMRGAVLEHVPDGESAYRAAMSARPDLIVADLRMPQMNGIELVATLRATPGLETIPILVLSGAVGDGEHALLRRMGVAACLIKPVPHARLVEAVRAALAMRDPSDSRVMPKLDPPSERTTLPEARSASERPR